MPQFSPQSLRTMALAGHGASGKTPLAEALLAKAGAIPARVLSKEAAPSAISMRGKNLPAFAQCAAHARRRPGRGLSIRGHAPLAELVDYQTRLKSVTAGQRSFSIELSYYDAAPAGMQKQLTEQHAKTAHAEED